MLRTILLATALTAFSTAAFADGLNDPVAARKACDDKKENTTPAKLKACCDDLILVDPPAKQAKLVKMCVEGKALPPKAPKKKS